MRELVAGTAALTHPGETREVEIAGEPAELVFRFLRELLYFFNTDGFVPGNVEIEWRTPEHLTARVHGEPFDPERHEPQPEVKAVTRHGLTVEHVGNRWRAEVVFDL